MAKSKITKAQVGVKSGKTEQEVRSAILKKADEIFKSGKKPYKVPDEIAQGSYLTGRKVCIQGVCGILSDAGFIPEDYYTNTKFAEKANELGFGYPITDINRLKPGDVFQHFTEKNEQGNYYPTHGEIFKGWNKEGEAEFYDYYDYYNYPLGMSEGIRTYSKDELMERLKRRAEKDNSGKQAQFFSIAGNFPTKKSFPYNLPEGELQQYFDKTHASKVRYAAPQSNIDMNSPLYTLSGEDVRQGTKDALVDSFNDSQLDSQLKKNLKITDQDLQRIKPLVYGIVGQETQFNSPKSGLGNLKYTLENLFQLEGTSLGPGQIKLNSISKDTRKKFNINKNKDLLDPKNTYIGLVDILSKAANITDKHITPESHPELVDKDRYERALYFVNSPGKVRKTDKQLSEDVMNKSPWWSDFSEKKMESNIRKAKNAPLRMDAASYPGKVVSKSGELEKDINFEDVGVLPEVSVTAPAKKQKNGGWLDKYDDGGEYLGTTNEGFDYNGAWGGQFQMGGSLPGPSGMMYARTQDPAPSNGPYAKKTKASAQNGKAVSDNTRVKPVVTEKPIHRETVTSTESFKSKDNRSIFSDSKAKERGEDLWGASKKVTAVGQFSPEPISRTASIALNSLMGAADAYFSLKDNDVKNARINAIGAIPLPGFGTLKTLKNVPGLNNRQKLSVMKTALGALGIDLFGTAADLTDNFDLEKKQNGGEVISAQDGKKSSKKKKTLILAESNPEVWEKQADVNPFITEAGTIKNYVNKYFPEEDVEIIPTYKHNIKEALAKSDPDTRLVVMGHHGNNMFGIPSEEFISSVGNTKYENCYAGICSGNRLPGIGPGREAYNPGSETQETTDRYPESYNLHNFNIRSNDKSWSGFAPVDRGGEEGFRDSFFRRTDNPEIKLLLNKIDKIFSNTKIDYDKQMSMSKPLQEKLSKIYKDNKLAINLEKAADTKKLEYVPFPGRTFRYQEDPLTFNPQKLLQKKKNGAEMKFYQEGLDWTPRNISRDGSEIPQAQPGKKQRAASDATRVAPRYTGQLTMKEAKEIEDANRFWNIIENQPVIQSPTGRQLSEEEIRRKNKQYAQQYGRRYNEKTGAVEAPYSKSLDRLNESMLNTANYALNLPPKLVQSLYKPDYTATDALKGKPNNASLVEDIITDPTILASGLLKFGLKGLTKGMLSKGLLSSAMLPFYKSIPRESADAARQSFYSNLDQVKSLLSSQPAKEAYKRVNDEVRMTSALSAIDPNYVTALGDPDLPVKALDKFSDATLSINPADNALTPDQVKYLDNLGSLYTDYKRIDKYNTNIEDRLQFLVENSKNISPRDILPILANENASGTQMNRFLKNLYDSYGGQAVNNPMAEYTAATDLLALADTYGYGYSPLSGKIKSGVAELSRISEDVKPKLIIDDPYFNEIRGNNDNAQEAIHLLQRQPYSSVPTQPERLRNMREAGKKVIETVNDVFSNPFNKGKVFVGAHSLSTDSYPLTLSLFSRNKDKFDFIPIHEGTQHAIYPYGNPMSGLSNYASSRRTYLDQVKGQFDTQFGSGYHQGTSLAGARQLQGQMIESGYLNHHIDKFNREVGTNMPAAHFSAFYNELKRPNVGVIIKKDGGDVIKDDRGQWAHPGEITEIQGDTMATHGYGDIPLWVEPDVGRPRLIKPNTGTHTFPGATKFKETPVSKKWLEKYK